MIQKMTTVLAIAIAGSATGQAVTGFSGGSEFAIFYGGSTGDVVGWRFDVNTSIILTDIGVWNADNQITPGLTSNHRVGLWDSGGNLLTAGSAGPGDPSVGDWNYGNVADVVLVPGERYTIGAMYSATDDDGYVSSPASIALASEINATTNGVFPPAGDLGFVFPTEDSTNLARLGPNFLFSPIPAPASAVLLGLGGLAATRRRR